jgi:nitrile hydratase
MEASLSVASARRITRKEDRDVNGVHDLGGMHGFGPIDRDEAIFHAEWERRINALLNHAVPHGLFNEDAFRYGIEQMEPAAYLATSYYGRWLASIVYNLTHHGWIDQQEFDAWVAHLRAHPDAPPPPASPVALPSSHHLPAEQPSPSPRFAVGDAVVARNIHPVGHTRLPRYARGKRGVVHLVHPAQLLPDSNAHGLPEDMQVVYTVRFDASELWGPSAEPHQTVSIDLWESYIVPADQ